MLKCDCLKCWCIFFNELSVDCLCLMVCCVFLSVFLSFVFCLEILVSEFINFLFLRDVVFEVRWYRLFRLCFVIVLDMRCCVFLRELVLLEEVFLMVVCKLFNWFFVCLILVLRLLRLVFMVFILDLSLFILFLVRVVCL